MTLEASSFLSVVLCKPTYAALKSKANHDRIPLAESTPDIPQLPSWENPFIDWTIKLDDLFCRISKHSILSPSSIDYIDIPVVLQVKCRQWVLQSFKSLCGWSN